VSDAHLICDREIERLTQMVREFATLTEKFLLVDTSGTIEDIVDDAERLLAESKTVGIDRFRDPAPPSDARTDSD
jgi:hypothetical protein